MKLLENWYKQQISNEKIILDNAQLTILQQLDYFIEKFNHLNFLNRIFNRPKLLGYYIYGSVGRGKSMIINQAYKFILTNNKLRIHFHEFMKKIHNDLAIFKDKSSPLEIIASKLAEKYKIIFLDEMHISDIATAMILKSLLTALFKNNIIIITTSNYKPDNLYFNGLLRERFFPAIDLIKKKLEVLSLDSDNDYRLVSKNLNNLFFIKIQNSQIFLNEIFYKISKKNIISEPGVIQIQSRELHFIKKSDEIIWFNFDNICGDKRSQLDYIELINKFKWFIIDNIFNLKAEDKNIARRFTWLIDILYDNKCKLVLSSNVNIEDIYKNGDFAEEFLRTTSRLIEMQTQEYLK